MNRAFYIGCWIICYVVNDPYYHTTRSNFFDVHIFLLFTGSLFLWWKWMNQPHHRSLSYNSIWYIFTSQEYNPQLTHSQGGWWKATGLLFLWVDSPSRHYKLIFSQSKAKNTYWYTAKACCFKRIILIFLLFSSVCVCVCVCVGVHRCVWVPVPNKSKRV